MDTATAAFWLDAITFGMATLWLAGAWFVFATRRTLAEPATGEVQSPAKPAELIAHLTQQIARGTAGLTLREAAIETATEREVRWRSHTTPRHTGSVAASVAGSGAHMRWEVHATSRLIGAQLIVACGAIVIVVLHTMLRQHALPSEHPAARGQVVQMVQAVHMLWPPFLVAGLARLMRNRAASDVERLVRNASFVRESAT